MRHLIISALVTAALTAVASTYAVEHSQVTAAAASLHQPSVHTVGDGLPMRLVHLPVLAS
jgi:hypothetical protein